MGLALLAVVLVLAAAQRSNAPAVVVAVPAVLSELAESIAAQRGTDGVPIFAGMPASSTWPAGYEPVNVWAERPGGGWEPRPDRFAQWAPLLEEMRTRQPFEEYAEQWANRHWFGVVDDQARTLEFYVFGRRRVNNARCCSEASHTIAVAGAGATSGGATVRVLRRSMTGAPPSPWVCEHRPAACYDVTPRPIIAWPLIDSDPPQPRPPRSMTR